jgi:hypothetical protein
MEVRTLVRLGGAVDYDIVESTEHDEGNDRGGSAVECHTFRVSGSQVLHLYQVDIDDPEYFGLDVERLDSKEQALKFVGERQERLIKSLADLDELKQKLQLLEYVDEDDDEDEDEDDDEDEDEDEDEY